MFRRTKMYALVSNLFAVGRDNIWSTVTASGVILIAIYEYMKERKDKQEKINFFLEGILKVTDKMIANDLNIEEADVQVLIDSYRVSINHPIIRWTFFLKKDLDYILKNFQACWFSYFDWQKARECVLESNTKNAALQHLPVCSVCKKKLEKIRNKIFKYIS